MSNETRDLVLTDEVKAKLKGMLAFDVKATFLYVPEVFRNGSNIPKEQWTVFKLKSKDGLEIAEIEDQAGDVTYNQVTNETKVKVQAGTVRIETLRKGVKGWKNLYDENGRAVPFDPAKHMIDGQLSGNALRMFPANLQTELQNVINERKTLSDEELTGLEF